jgi:hypothetical protein
VLGSQEESVTEESLGERAAQRGRTSNRRDDGTNVEGHAGVTGHRGRLEWRATNGSGWVDRTAGQTSDGDAGEERGRAPLGIIHY